MNIQAIQEEIVDEFSMFEDWMQRYEYMIDLGKSLPLISEKYKTCLLYTSPSPRDGLLSRMPSSA